MNGKGPRLALVGYGRIARKHVEVFRALEADVVASCNRSERGRQLAEQEGGIRKTYADPLEMLDREKPDGVIVAASVLSIFDIGRKLIPWGIPMLLEKPPGTSLAEAKELAALADQHKAKVMVGLNRRFYSVYHSALELIGGREAVTAVSVEWSEDPKKMLELGHPEEILPKLNFANSLHGIDLLTFFGGVVVRPRTWGRNLDPTAAECRWQMALDGVNESGTRVHFSSNWDAPGRWRLVADAPGCRIVSAPLETVSLLRRGRPPESLVAHDRDRRFKPGFHGQADAFLRTIRDETTIAWPASSLSDALPSMELAEALTQACLTPTESV